MFLSKVNLALWRKITAVSSLAVFMLFATASGFAQQNKNSASEFLQALKNAPSKVILSDGSEAPKTIVLTRKWTGDLCHFTLTNRSASPVSIREAIIFDFQHGLLPSTPIFGEGFQMLAMTGGTLAHPQDIGSYSDRAHYKITEPEGLRTAYGVFTAHPANGDRILLASTSCFRFISRFSFDARRLRISFNCENLTLAPGQTWKLEEFIATSGSDRDKLYDQLTEAVAKNHPRLKHTVPAGWCSWVCFGSNVTAKNVSDVTNWIAKNLPALKYIQIDDGYQPWMGDWLESGPAFHGGVQKVLSQIRSLGLQPGIWVAPFIASPQSHLFKNHPDWFVKDSNGDPLRSDKVSFGGWRLGPWYVLDGTNPGAQNYLTMVFRTMREKWGVTYFKLDANYWGAIQDGVHYDKNATRIEAYRRGMEAILKGAGADAFLDGCNQPIWPSFGLIQGARSSMDIAPNWKAFVAFGMQTLRRNWQNGGFWWNDPDTVLLNDASVEAVTGPDGKPTTIGGKMTEGEFRYHVTNIYAAGGFIFSGDDLTKITPAHLALLKKLLPPTGVAARFADDKFDVGEIDLPKETVYAVFNRENTPQRRVIHLKAKSALTEKLTGANLGVHEGDYVIEKMPARDGLLIEAKPL